MKKILKGFGYVLTVLAMFFIVRKLLRMDVDFQLIFGKHMPLFIACIVGYAVLVYFLGWPWKRFVVQMTGKEVTGREVYYICTKANLMKYIPGNVLQFVGRNEIAVNHDMRHRDVACATLLDTLCMVLSALTVAILFYSQGLLQWFLQYMPLQVFLCGGIVLLGLGLLVLWLVYQKVPYFRFVFEKENLVNMLKGTAFFWIFYLGSASMFLTILHVVTGTQLPLSHINVLIGTWALGYLMGYVMPGAPGGMGIRELVLCFLLQGIVGQEDVLLATVLLRIMNIFGEIVAFAVAALLERSRQVKVSGDT